jgi:hypothetical protein
MKNFRIKIIDKKSNDLINDFTEISATKKFLETKYNSKYRFSYPDYKITIERIVKKHGIQMNIFDIIEK